VWEWEAGYNTVRENGKHYNLLVSEKHSDTNPENLLFHWMPAAAYCTATNDIYKYMDTYGVCVLYMYSLIMALLALTIQSTLCVYNKGNI
jgi:hypothetical protein